MKQVATPTLRRQRRLAQRRFARVSKWPRPSPFRRPPREYLWGPWLRSKLRGGPPWCWNGKNHGFGSFGDQHAGSLHKPSLSRQSMRISPTLGETTLNKPSPAEALYENSPNAPTNPPFCNVLICQPPLFKSMHAPCTPCAHFFMAKASLAHATWERNLITLAATRQMKKLTVHYGVLMEHSTLHKGRPWPCFWW